MKIGTHILVLSGLLLLTACAGTPPTAPVDDRETTHGRTVYRENVQPLPASAPIATTQDTDNGAAPLGYVAWHTVVKGDTLYSIAFLHNLHFEDIAAWNSIRSPYLIRIGEQLRLTPPEGFARPPETQTAAAAPAPAKPPVKASAPKPKPLPKAKPATVKPKARKPVKSRLTAVPTGPLRWRWPTRGKMISKFTTRGTRKRGIVLSGKPGQVIRAAAQGRVVYSGSGLVGYGKLVIVKHNKTYLSAYGHNRKLLVSEGDIVKSGDPIAEMGSTDASSTRLHFEIRKRGKSVNPLRYLPRS